MKNILAPIVMTFLLFLGSCGDFLNYNEYDFFVEKQIFSNFDHTKKALNSLYGIIPGGIHDVNNSMRCSATDDAMDANPMRPIHIMNDGRWSATRTIDDKWDKMYEGIRAANRFLSNIDLSALDDIRYNDDYDKMLTEYTLFGVQARFLRAYFYYELIRRYGQVPLLEDKVLTMNEANSQVASSFEEVKEYIVKECDAIIPDLPENYNMLSGDHNGRITQGVAMALKARVLLLAASPLYNTTDLQEKWIKAAEASYAIIESKLYSLESDYSKIVNNNGSKELIFGKRLPDDNSFEKHNFPVGYVGAEPGNCPTQNLVDTYRMKNGKKITDEGSTFDPDNPYKNRDPRLEQTIIVNNSSWKNRKVEIWRGGQDGQPKPYSTKTGYYLKKYLVEAVSLDAAFTTTAKHLEVLFRYGEVLLNYAEAMNEAFGPTYSSPELNMTAYEAVNLIRKRATMPDFEPGMSKDEFRQELRDERRVELAFEDHRFWDIRRWTIGNQTTNIRGVNITRNDDGTFNYNVETVENRHWEDKMNLYPIPQSERYKNPALTQNEGW